MFQNNIFRTIYDSNFSITRFFLSIFLIFSTHLPSFLNILNIQENNSKNADDNCHFLYYSSSIYLVSYQKIRLWYDKNIPALLPLFLLMQNPHQKMMEIHWRTILLLSHLYSKWQLFTHRIIYTPHHRQVAKSRITLLIPRRITNGKHLLLFIVEQNLTKATNFSMLLHLFMVNLLLPYVYFIIFQNSEITI